MDPALHPQDVASVVILWSDDRELAKELGRGLVRAAAGEAADLKIEVGHELMKHLLGQ